MEREVPALRSCQVSAEMEWGKEGLGRGWTLGRQDLCSFPGLPLTLCDMSLFRDSSCRNLWVLAPQWPPGSQEPG